MDNVDFVLLLADKIESKDHLVGVLSAKEVADGARAAALELHELRAENLRLKMIAAKVPARDYIRAKEAAGFGAPVKVK
jgi:hypothetical protein